MVLKVIKALIVLLAIGFSFSVQALTVTPVWQGTEIFLFLVLFCAVCLLIYRSLRQSSSSPDPRLALLWRHVPDIITEIDCDGIILTVNHAVEGFSQKDLIGRSSFDFLTEEGQRVFSKSLQKAIENQEVQRYELNIVSPEGASVWISNRIVPIIEHQKIVSLLIITTDITEQKIANEVLLAAKSNAEKANVAKSQFLASMSHEIRTPMTGMLGMASLLEQTDLSHEQQECVLTIQQSAEHLLSIINDVLDLSKIEANKLTIESESIELDQFMSSLVDMVGNKAREKGLNLQTFIDEKVPNYIISDSVRLRQILMNYLANAIKFTMKGHVIIRVMPLQVKDSSVSLRFSVEDTGIGMSADKAAYVFDEFTDAHGQQSVRMGGSGLGLNICQRLAQMMDGSVGVVSSPNLGSNFWLDLEVAITSCDNKHYDHKIIATDDQSPSMGLVAWVLDEVKVNRLLLKEVAKRSGFIVREFNQLSHLLDELENQSGPDLLVFSLELGSKKIDRILDRVKTLNSSAYLAMTTVEAINLDYNQLVDQGIHAFWEWPLGQHELNSMLERLFSHDWQEYPKTLITRYKRTLITSEVKSDCRGKILLAEDNLVNQKVTTQMLKKMGFDVDVANDGEEALAAWKREDYDVILMDCHMPIMDGLQATRMIRMQEDDKHTPILALTADVLSERKAECIAVGMDDFMSKPIRMDELRKALAKFSQ